ncbi:MAG TPA: exopolysaccharide biosynthesis protein [Acetobacteraceae bacterium]|nr:exopolysaccharide biosynthesis protein [Acetobacteraceae bacterium]
MTAQLRASRLMAGLRRRVGGETTTVGEMLGHLGDRATAFLLLVLAIPALIPSTGLPIGAMFGAAMSVIALQMLLGREAVTLPGFIARRSLTAAQVEALVRRSVPVLRRAERHLRPRLGGLARAGRLPALLVLLHGVLIVLPIPLGNTLPGLAVILIALGLLVRDGAAVAAGLVVSVAAVAFAAVMVGAVVWAGGAVMA